MTTENGVPSPKEVRGKIKVLAKRRDFLAEKLAGWVEENGTEWEFTHTFTYQEIQALSYAIDVLEVEYANVARLFRNNHNIERQLEAQERNPSKVNVKVHWSLAN